MSIPARFLRYTRLLTVFAAVILLLVTAVVSVLQFWLLPNIDQWRDTLSASISRASGQTVVLGRLQAGWNGWHPSARIQSITVTDKLGRPLLVLGDIQADLAWSSLLSGGPVLSRLALGHQLIELHRDKQGLIWLGGIALNHPGNQNDFADWLARQDRILLNHAILTWQDDTRPAPKLVVHEVNLDLVNRRSRHHFHLSATPPTLLAHPLDISGDIKTQRLANPASWLGTVRVNVQGTDISQWLPWVTLPLGINKGYGNVDLSLAFADSQFTSVTASVLLSQLSLQTSADKPRIDLLSLSGLLEWKRLRRGQSLQLKQLSLRSSDLTYVPPLDFYIKLAPADGKNPATGELTASNLDLQTLAHLTGYLPLTTSQRDWLAHYQPRGTLRNVKADWQGDFPQPAHYHLAGRFSGLGLLSVDNHPGFSGISGSIDGSDVSGNLQLNSRHASFDLPGILFEPHVGLDVMTASIVWQKSADLYHFRLSQASIANPDLNGTLFGTWIWKPGIPGTIDLSGMLLNGNGAATAHYLPLAVQQPAYDWLRQNLLSGKARDVQFHLAGDLAHYPFHNDSAGQLDVRIRVVDASLRPTPDFPVIDHIDGMVQFTGTRMHIHANSAKLYSARLSNVNADIANLFGGDQEKLQIDGDASGNADAFVRFVNHSPVNKVLDNLTANLQASGEMKLHLGLILPFHDINKPLINGKLFFLGNRTLATDKLPAMDNISGSLNFTESSLAASGITLRLFGQPAQLACQTTADATLISLRGTLPATSLSQWLPQSLASRFSGTTNWSSRIQLVHGQFSSIDFTSDLQGMAINLPDPFGKPARQHDVLHMTSTPVNGGNQIAASYDGLATAQLLTVSHNGQTSLDRGAISLGGQASLPSASGLWISGQLASLDTGSWLGLVDGGSKGFQQADVNLTVGDFNLLDHHFSHVGLHAWSHGSQWLTSINGNGIQGNMTWSPASTSQPHGNLTAHFSHLLLTSPSASPPPPPTRPASPQDVSHWPVLAIHVDDLQLGQRTMGQLDIAAHPENAAVAFDHIRLVHPDSTLDMTAMWQPAASPQTSATIRLHVNNLGSFMNRFGEPDTIQRGEADLDGDAAWDGAPVDLPISSLNGHFSLSARNGQFLKADPGVAKLLGVLSLQDLPHHIALDFRDVFSAGFAFDDISATLQLNRGIIRSSDFAMQGPAATVEIRGTVDLNSQTQLLEATIRPHLSESVALASSLVGGPVVGLGVLAVQKLLSNPLGHVVEYTYAIDGSWTAPQIRKLDHANEK